MPLSKIDEAGLASSAQFTGFKNRIINGDMRIDQRNAGASVTPIDTVARPYALDRWCTRQSQASKFSIQQSSTAPTGFINSSLITSLSAYSITSSDQFVFLQIVEGLNASDLAWGTESAATVNLSFQVRSSLTGTFGGSLRNVNGDRSYPFSYTINVANTWETKTLTIAGDTSGTWVTTNGIGITVGFGFGVGSTLSGTAGAWAATNYASATGATSVVGTNGATFYITGVQLEKGSTATSFDYRPYGTELALCQRYFETNYDIGTAPANGISNFDGYKSGVRTASELYGLHPIKFQVAKRGQPTITYYRPSQTATNGQWAYYDGSSWVASTNTRTDSAGFTSFGVVMSSNSLTNQNVYLVQGGWVASSEL
jgi:hypothetical protein